MKSWSNHSFVQMLCLFLSMLYFCFAVTPASASANPPKAEQITIATADGRPISVDRLVYAAFKDIGWRAAFAAETPLIGCAIADSAGLGGVISSTPDIERTYKNLVRVDVPLEETYVYAFIREGSEHGFSSWEDLSGHKVGYLPQNTYIESKIPAGAFKITSESSIMLFKGLEEGEFDVAVISRSSHETLPSAGVNVLSEKLDTLSEYLYINKSYKHIIDELTGALNNIVSDGLAVRILNDIPQGEAGQEKTVLHIISSSLDNPNEKAFFEELRERFKDDDGIEWYTVELKAERYETGSSRYLSFSRLLRQDFVSKNIAAIVVSAGEGLDFVTEQYFTMFRGAPVIFYGANENDIPELADYGRFFTGVTTEYSVSETVSAALQLLPGTKNIYVASGSETEGRVFLSNAIRQLEPFREKVNIIYSGDVSRDEMMRDISGLSDDTIVILGPYSQDVFGRYYPAYEMARVFERDCSVPVFTFASSLTGFGPVGGMVIDYKKMSAAVASVLEILLSGEQIANIPVLDTESYNSWVFDKKVLEKHKIDESKLPKNSLIIGKPPSMLNTDSNFAAAILLLAAVGCAAAAGLPFILYCFSRKKETIKALNEITEHYEKIRGAKERLEGIINKAPVLYVLSAEGIVIDSNEYARSVLDVVPGSETIKMYADRSERDSIINRAEEQELVKNEIIRLFLATGEKHRFLANLMSVPYEKSRAHILWGVDMEESERKRDTLRMSQRRLRNVTNRLERIIVTSPFIFMITIDGVIAELNKNARELLGLDTGSHIKDVYEYPEKCDDFYKRVTKSGVIRNEPERLRFSDGTIHRCLLNTAVSDYDGKTAVVMWAADIEASEAQKDQLSLARQSLQTLLDTLPIPVRLLDLETLMYVYANQKCLDLFGYKSIEEACCHVSRARLDLSAENASAEDLEAFRQEVLSMNGVGIKELTYIAADGSPLETLLTSVVANYNGRPTSICILRDLAEEKEFERMLRSAAEKEKEANLLKSRFLVNMSHEIRTPMNAIIGLTEIELRKPIPSKSKMVYSKIHDSAKNLLSIINDILDLSKIESDNMVLNEEEFELDDVLNSVLLVVMPGLEGKRVELVLDESLDLPRFLIGDKAKLWQVLKNFLDNSAKLTENGSIKLSIGEEETLSSGDTVFLNFVVEDTGIGISGEQMKKIFEPYERDYLNAQKRYDGYGVGMTVSKKVCEFLGGAVEIDSVVGEGTKISFYLPFRRSGNTETEREAAVKTTLKGKKILIADDDKNCLAVMEKLIRSAGAECTAVETGEGALEAVIESREKAEGFDLILLDYMMEGINGLEAAKRIQTGLSDPPALLLVTAFQRLFINEELEQSEIFDVIEKPFPPKHFIKKIQHALELASAGGKEQTEAVARFKDVNVLLCEDYRLNQEVEAGMLQQLGVKTFVAENGREGIELLESGQRFDLIFMDIHMPVIDGYEAARIIRADKRFDDIPIISLTADAMKEAARKCLEAGMDDYLVRPVDFASLQRIFAKWLPREKRDAEAEHSSFAELPDNREETPVLMRFGGDKGFYENSLFQFSDDLPVYWQSFDEIVQSSGEMLLLLHKIKGAAGNLIETALYDAAAGFENSLRTQNPDRELYERFIGAVAEVKDRVSAFASSKEAEKSGGRRKKESGTADEFRERFAALKKALASLDLNEIIEAADALAEKTWPLEKDNEERLLNILKLADGYEYFEALEEAEKLIITLTNPL